jgi:hypothetical protein
MTVGGLIPGEGWPSVHGRSASVAADGSAGRGRDRTRGDRTRGGRASARERDASVAPGESVGRAPAGGARAGRRPDGWSASVAADALGEWGADRCAGGEGENGVWRAEFRRPAALSPFASPSIRL